LGTISYIIPDHILPNARVLCPVIDDIELVLFESPDFSNIPSKDDIRELALLAKDHGTGYTIHLPTDRKAGSTSKKERQELMELPKNRAETLAEVRYRSRYRSGKGTAEIDC